MSNNYVLFSFEVPLKKGEIPWVKNTLSDPPDYLCSDEGGEDRSVDFEWTVEDGEGEPCLYIYSEESGDINKVEEFLKMYLAYSDTDLTMIGFEVAFTSSSPKPGEFGGAACLVYVDRETGDINSIWASTSNWLDEFMGSVKEMKKS